MHSSDSIILSWVWQILSYTLYSFTEFLKIYSFFCNDNSHLPVCHISPLRVFWLEIVVSCRSGHSVAICYTKNRCSVQQPIILRVFFSVAPCLLWVRIAVGKMLLRRMCSGSEFWFCLLSALELILFLGHALSSLPENSWKTFQIHLVHACISCTEKNPISA